MKLLAWLTPKRLESLLKYFTAAVLVFIPLYPKFPLFFVPFSTVAVRAEDFLIAVSILILFLYLWRTRPSLPPLLTPVAAFLFIGAASAVSAILVTKNVAPPLVILHWLRRIEYLSVFFLCFYAGRLGESNRRFYLELIFFPVAGVFLYGLAQVYLAAPVISTMNREFSKGVALVLQPGVQLSSTFAGHYDLAIYLGMITVYLFVLFTKVKTRSRHLWLLLSAIAVLWLFGRAGSRIGLLGLITALALLSHLTKNYRAGLLFIFLVSLTVLTSPNLLNRMRNLLRIVQPQSYLLVRSAYAQEQEPLRPIQADRSTSIRFDVEWPMAIRSFLKNPFFGTGYSSLGLASDNDYLRALGETGGLGLASFLLMLYSLGRRLWRRFRDHSRGADRILTVGGIGIFTLFLICALFLDVFESSKIAILFWAFSGLSLSTKS